MPETEGRKKDRMGRRNVGQKNEWVEGKEGRKEGIEGKYTGFRPCRHACVCVCTCCTHVRVCLCVHRPTYGVESVVYVRVRSLEECMV